MQNPELAHLLLSQGYVPIHMKKESSGHLHLQAILNGESGDFILDTGAGGTVIEISKQEKFGMSQRETEERAAGAGASNLHMQESPGNNLVLDKLELSDRTLVLMDLSHVNAALQQRGIPEVDGVIGADVLTSQKAVIDYANLVLYLQENS